MNKRLKYIMATVISTLMLAFTILLVQPFFKTSDNTTHKKPSGTKVDEIRIISEKENQRNPNKENSLFEIEPQEKINIRDFGAIGNGESDDYQALQKAINAAASQNAILELERGATYRTTKPLAVKCTIDGNSSQLSPDFGNTRALYFVEDGVKLQDLKIASDKMLYINVTANDIEFNNCEIIGNSYLTLISLKGNNCKIINSKIINRFNRRHQYAIRSSTNVNKLLIDNSYIYGGIYLANNSPQKTGNYTISNNKIEIDYTHAKQEMRTQHDGFHIQGIDGVKIFNNEIYFKNVNRGFKCTDYKPNKNTDLVSRFPTTNLWIHDNIIRADSKNGKQLFDFYDGTAKARIQKNKIYSVGHTVIFEDKTAAKLSIDRQLTIDSNDIYFDFKLLYYRGNYGSKNQSGKTTLNVTNNNFYFTPKQIKNKLIRQESNTEVKLQYPFYIRSVNEFSFINNNMESLNLANPFKNYYTLYILETGKSIVLNNILSGGILFNGNVENSLAFKDNNVKNIQLPNLIKTVSHNIQDYKNFDITDNVINYSGKSLIIPSAPTRAGKQNNKVRKYQER